MKKHWKVVFVAIAATMLATPALAWTCHAKNARGANYYGVALFRTVALNRALAQCHANSLVPGSCVIVNCTVP